jgi:acetolactate synthase-1/2/3 large subunit/5-guanidino-2-oxopentanoate decarboxylase
LRKSGAASFTSYAGRGIPAPDDPLGYGATLARPDSARQIAKADLVIVVGCELAQVDLWRDDLGHTGELVRVDTDEAVLNDVHDADLKIRADADAFLQGLAARLVSSPQRWNGRDIARARSAFRAETIAERPGIAPYAEALRMALPDDTHIYSDMTQFAYVSKEILNQPMPGRWHHPYGFGTLGYGVPAAIGGKVAMGRAPVLAIVGDSGFQYTMQELGVAAELGLGLPIVLWDNEKLKEIEEAMIHAQIAPNAVTARNPNFEMLAKSYAIDYAAPENPDEFGVALAQALEKDRPTLVHLRAQKLA